MRTDRSWRPHRAPVQSDYSANEKVSARGYTFNGTVMRAGNGPKHRSEDAGRYLVIGGFGVVGDDEDQEARPGGASSGLESVPGERNRIVKPGQIWHFALLE